MEDKIYEIIKEKNAKSSGHYMKILGIVEDENSIKFGTPKKNIDLMIILSNLGLIEPNPENGEIIDDYHDYLYKFGINLGIGNGKKIIIDSIKENPNSFETIMELDPEEFVNYDDIKPTFIHDLKESITNEQK